jgi:type II secretory pathway component PulF
MFADRSSLGLKAYLKDEERKWKWDQFKLRWVAIGDLIKKIEVARFSRTLGTLLHASRRFQLPLIFASKVESDLPKASLSLTYSIF